MAAVLVVLLPLLSQVPEVSLLYRAMWQWVSGRPLAALTVMALVSAALVGGGWRVLGPLQRWAWVVSCVAGYLAVVQGWRMQAFHGVSGPDWTYPVVVGRTVLWLLVPLLLWRWQPTRLEPLVRVGLAATALVTAVFCVGQHLLFRWGGTIAQGVRILAPIDSFGIYDDAIRLGGLMNNPNLTAAMLVVCWPALLGRNSSERGLTALLMMGTGICMVVLALLLTYTRAAYIGLLAQVMVLAVLVLRTADRGTKVWLGRTLAILLAALLLIALAMSPVARRFAHLAAPTDSSVLHRLHVYQAIGQLILERPLCGWGDGIFGVLYRGFERIPGMSYVYGDAHSALLLWLFESGAIGCLLVLVAVGGWRIRHVLPRTPVWMATSLVGALPLLLTDNSTLMTLCVSVPLLMIAAVLAGLGRNLERRCPPPRWARAAILGAGACWIAAALQSPTEPINRLEARLAQSARRMKGDVSFVVQDQTTGGRWGISAGRPFPSILAGLAAVADASLAQPHAPVGLPGFRLAPGAPSELHPVATRADLAALLLSEPSHATAVHLVRAMGIDELRQSCGTLFGHPGFREGELREACADCATLDIKPAREPESTALAALATTATITQVLNAYWHLTDRATTSGAVAAAALAHSRDEAGLARHLQAEPRLQGLSVYTGPLREEVLLVRDGWQSWGMAARYASEYRITARTDSVANRMFADMGWKVSCYLDTFARAMITGGSQEDASLERTSRGAWFLRTGKVQWPAPPPVKPER